LTSPGKILASLKKKNDVSIFFSRIFDTPQRRDDQIRKRFGPNVEIIRTIDLSNVINNDSNSKSTAALQGLAVIAALWKAVAEPPSSSSLETVITFSQTQQQQTALIPVMQNWVEIYNWWLQETNQQDRQQIEFVLVEDSIPCIRIQTTSSTSSTSSQRSNNPLSDNSSITAAVESTTIIINQSTQQWVQRLLVEQQICPFTKSRKYSGQGLADVNIPVGRIDYQASTAVTMEALMADTWTAILNMIQSGPQQVSSILLAAPNWNQDFDEWAGPIFHVLEACVVVAQAEGQVGVVCFHPLYQVSDGSVFPGFGHMHSVPRLEQWVQQDEEQQQQQQGTLPLAISKTDSRNTTTTTTTTTTNGDLLLSLTSCDVAAGGAWQRRTPHATINVLRADQLEAAEKKRFSSKLYPRNIRRLYEIGWDKLQEDLDREQQQQQQHTASVT
jgi:hypothetical protein